MKKALDFNPSGQKSVPLPRPRLFPFLAVGAPKSLDVGRTGAFQLGRWEIGASPGLHLDDSEIPDATTIATLCIVLPAGKFLAGQGHSADCEQIETLAEDYATRAS